MEVVKSLNPEEQKSSKLTVCTLLVGGCSLVTAIVGVALKWGNFSKIGQPRVRQRGFQRGLAGDPYKDTGFFNAFGSACEYVEGRYGAAVKCGEKTQFVPHSMLKVAGICLLVAAALSLIFCIFTLLSFAMEKQNKNICVKYIRSLTATVVLAVLAELATLASIGLGVLQFIKSDKIYKVHVGGGYIVVIVLFVLNIFLLGMSIARLKRAKKEKFPKDDGKSSVYTIPVPDPPKHGVLRGPSPTMDNGVQRIRQPHGVLSSNPMPGGSIGSFNMSAVSDTTSIGSAGSLQSNYSGRSAGSENSVRFSIKSEQTSL